LGNAVSSFIGAGGNGENWLDDNGLQVLHIGAGRCLSDGWRQAQGVKTGMLAGTAGHFLA